MTTKAIVDSTSLNSSVPSADSSPLAKEFPAWDLMPPALLVRRRKRSVQEAAPSPPPIPPQAAPQRPPPLIQ
ncbi:MAG: hypothetical protein HY735_08765 [Verrucomicrobia bacterium]|nr:hypothetical protein [Verrucomicrobiota bacterium]